MGSPLQPPAAELVDLVEQHDRVHRAGLDDRPGDAARLAADVGAAVAADLGLVADAAERDAHELAAHRPGDGLAEAGLADAWRADEREDGARLPSRRRRSVGCRRAGRAQLADGEELDDAVLDLVEAVVVGVEHRAGLRRGRVGRRCACSTAARRCGPATCGSRSARATAGRCAPAGRSPC